MSRLGRDNNNEPIQAIEPGQSQAVSFTGTAGRSSALGPNTTCIRLHATEACWIKFGDSTVTAVAAEAGSHFLPADETEYFACDPGQYVSAVQATTAGSIYISEAL